MPYCVFLVDICWGHAVFARIGTNSVCPTVMCKITFGSTTTASTPIPVVLCATSYSTAVTGLVAVVSTSSRILAASIVFTSAMGRCGIFHLCSLHHCLHFLQLCGQLSLGFSPRFPHDPQAPAQPSESPSGRFLVARLHVSMCRNFSPCWHDAYLRLQR